MYAQLHALILAARANRPAATSTAAAADGPADAVRVCVGKEWYRFPSRYESEQ